MTEHKKRGPKTKITRSLLIAAQADGKTNAELALDLGMTKTGVFMACKREGITLAKCRKKNGAVNVAAKIWRDHAKDGAACLSSIAREIGTSKQYVSRVNSDLIAGGAPIGK